MSALTHPRAVRALATLLVAFTLAACNDKSDDGAATGDTSGVSAIPSGTPAGESARAAPDMVGASPSDSTRLDSIRKDSVRRAGAQKP